MSGYDVSSKDAVPMWDPYRDQRGAFDHRYAFTKRDVSLRFVWSGERKPFMKSQVKISNGIGRDVVFPNQRTLERDVLQASSAQFQDGSGFQQLIIFVNVSLADPLPFAESDKNAVRDFEISGTQISSTSTRCSIA